GARVIKLERPEGDFARGYDHNVNGMGSYFVWLNRGKESVCINLKTEADKALLERLLVKADVFIQNLKPGVMAKMGFASARLREDYPRLITCDISGYGEGNDYSEMKAYDMLVQAESGLCSITGSAEQPGRIGVSACDVTCGMFAYMGIMEALYAREKTGQGMAVATSLFEGMADWMAVPLMIYEYGGKVMQRSGLSHPIIQPYGAFATRGGPAVMIAIQNQREYADLCIKVLQQPDLKDDPRFVDNQQRVANTEAMREAVEAVFCSLERAELLDRLRTAGIAYGEVNSVEQLSTHPALRRMEVQTGVGLISLTAPAIRRNGITPKTGPVPEFAEHDAAIRAEFS
ncbi:MAG: CaiB/BaiF CoA-transferase family protein, partial [Mariprofundaceae bacterium]|nr:CaiB/BaiF CoA-transferase family protein [Mariprofundaceae bacterium]